TDAQLESNEEWEIIASSSLDNGCSAEGIIEIQNQNKFWNTPNTDWASTNWKPGVTAPTIDHCVNIKTPVFIPAATTGLARNLKIHSTGTLNIRGNAVLNVENEIINLGSENNFIIESDANLLQNNPLAVNTGNIRAERFVQNMNNILP